MTETIYFIYSQFSTACSQVFPHVQQLAAYLHMIPVCIDDNITRHKISKSAIRSVPCFLVQNATQANIYEGQQFYDLLGQTQLLVQKQQQQAMAAQQPPEQQHTQLFDAPPQNTTSVQTIVPPNMMVPQTTAKAVQSTINDRLAPINIEPAADSMMMQTSPITTIQPPIQQQAPVQQQTTLMSQPPPMMNNELGATIIDDTIFNAPSNDPNVAGGLSMNDIGVKELRSNQAGTKSYAEQMQAEREEEDKKYNSRMH
jgi:hypothetical protein